MFVRRGIQVERRCEADGDNAGTEKWLWLLLAWEAEKKATSHEVASRLSLQAQYAGECR